MPQRLSLTRSLRCSRTIERVRIHENISQPNVVLTHGATAQYGVTRIRSEINAVQKEIGQIKKVRAAYTSTR